MLKIVNSEMITWGEVTKLWHKSAEWMLNMREAWLEDEVQLGRQQAPDQQKIGW